MPFARKLSANTRHPEGHPLRSLHLASYTTMPSSLSKDSAFSYMLIIQRPQQGMVTLAMTLLVLFLSSLMIFQSSTGMLFEIKTGNNQISHSKALEAARGGVESALAWLASGSVSSSALTNASNWNGGQANSSLFPNSIASQSISAIAVDVTLWQIASTTSSTVLEIRASSSGDAMATVKQRVELVSELTSTPSTETKTVNLTSVAPIVVNGNFGVCVNKNGKGYESCINGSPDLTAGDAGTSPTDSTGNAIEVSGTTILTGHLAYTGDLKTGAFTGTAWDYVFKGISKAQMLAAANAQLSLPLGDRTILYYQYDTTTGQITPPFPSNSSTWHTSLGSKDKPVILIFDTYPECPRINGGGTVTIWGVVYYGSGCTNLDGGGSAEFHGSLVTESNLNDLNANTKFFGWTQTTGSTTTIGVPITTTTTSTLHKIAKKTASWRDF